MSANYVYKSGRNSAKSGNGIPAVDNNLFDNGKDAVTTVGFRSYKLSPSNFKVWRDEDITDENIEGYIEGFIDPVKPESETENMLVEILLKYGFPLTVNVEKRGEFYCVNGVELIIALTSMTPAITAEIIALQPPKVVALDRLFHDDDELKTNTALQMRDAGVEFRTI